MRVVIKPAGLLILITVIAALSCLAFFGLPRTQTTASTAAPVAQPNSGPVDLYGNRAWEMTLSEPGAADMKESKESVPGLGEPTKVYTVVMAKAVKDPWVISFRLITPTNVVKGETLRFTFRARSPQAAPVTVNFEQNAEPYNKSVTQNIATTKEWKSYTVEFKPIDNYAAEKTHTTLHCGFKTGSLQFADLHLYRGAK